MLFFRKKQPTTVDLGWLHTDMHTHLLPGLDDGAPDMESSLNMLRAFVQLGYKRIISTPHIYWELYPNTPETISPALAQLQAAARSEGLEIELKAAAEYFLDDHFSAQVKAKAPLLCLSDKLVLVEFSMVLAPLDLQDTLFELQLQGYQPVLAHPERYTYLLRKKGYFDTLRDAGCLFQLNLLSLTGFYGDESRQLAEYLLKNDYYQLAGTDAHHDRQLALLHKLSSSPLYRELQEREWMNSSL
ncbi:CpsB/CapC family capsule biosynthesis tyrosine phosphatase [Paraflavisolibacter sp. H34]|uniref:tyrosine-protein phosphatase n=1 Tax=Huijunlia imazamoxiresistens TaxID=3127457 RepID=UPI0030178B8C